MVSEPAGAKALRLAWWGADGCTSGGQSPACLLGGGGGGWVLTHTLSPSSSIQGSLPQPPPVDVMAAPALSCCLSLLVLLLPLAIPQASTSVNGEDPSIWAFLRREAEALLELVLRPLILGRSSISRGRRWGRGPMGPETRYLPSPSTILSTLYPQASPNPGRQCLLVLALPRPVWESLQAVGFSFVFSEVDPLTLSLPTRIEHLLT